MPKERSRGRGERGCMRSRRQAGAKVTEGSVPRGHKQGAPRSDQTHSSCHTMLLDMKKAVRGSGKRPGPGTGVQRLRVRDRCVGVGTACMERESRGGRDGIPQG